MIIDTHAHYDDEAFDEDRDQLIRGFAENGIEMVVNVGAGIETSKRTLELVAQYENVYGAVGVHPDGVQDLTEADMEWLKSVSGREKIVAIGEIGLDYYWDTAERQIQKKWFVRQLGLAREVGLPVIIHSREAAADTLEIMKAEKSEEIGGVIHCFSYGVEMAREYLKMGFFLGIGGVLTFKNGRRLKEVVEYAPMESLVLETDSPYLTPVPYRGKRNNSNYLPLVVEELAKIKGLSAQEVIDITRENALRLYRISGRDR
ncbi:MAG: TatD family hydrolase [bacterium]|nr:TatD family hydrolase [bacterium]